MVRLIGTLAAMLTLSLLPPVFADVCFYGDGNGDADVDFADYAELQLCFTGPGGPITPECESFDFDTDGDVDLDDCVAFDAAVTGPSATFDYGPSPRDDAEAEQLALENFPSLIADDIVYGRIQRDLAFIREFQPNVTNVIHDMNWVPNQMIVKVTDGVPRCEFDALNAFYRMTQLEFLFQSGGGTWYVVHYPGRMRIPLLATHYTALPEVQFAEPNALIGSDDHIDVQEGIISWRYDVDDGFHDCFDGCDCHIYWTFQVTETGLVEQTDRQCVGLPWCEFPDFCFSE